AGDVLAGLGVEDHEVDPVLHHLAQMIEGDTAAGRRVVEPAIGVFLDGDRRFLGSGGGLGHGDFPAIMHRSIAGLRSVMASGSPPGAVLLKQGRKPEKTAVAASWGDIIRRSSPANVATAAKRRAFDPRRRSAWAMCLQSASN